jgi:hypothetical protein
MLIAYYHGHKPLEYFDSRIIIDVLTIVLAGWGIWYAAGHEYELISQLGQLRKVEESLSTRRIPFPQYLGEIGNLAKTARYLDIFVDCLDYGSFSSPEVHQRVHDNICEAARNRKVRLLLCGIPEPETVDVNASAVQNYEFLKNFGDFGSYTPAERNDFLERYRQTLRNDHSFRAGLNRMHMSATAFTEFAQAWFTKWRPDASIITRCIEVFSNQLEIPPNLQSEQLLKSLLQLRHLWFAEGLKKANVEIRSSIQSQSMFFWLKYDEKEKAGSNITDGALFTFAIAARGAGRLGYATHDPDLLRTFSEIFNDKWEKAEKECPPWLKLLKEQFLL